MPDSEAYRNFIKDHLGVDPGGFIWCMHCEKTFVFDGKTDRCLNDDCDGNPVDWYEWKNFRSMHFDGDYFISNYGLKKEDVEKLYPEIPVRGVVYPLYPDLPMVPAQKKSFKGRGAGKA